MHGHWSKFAKAIADCEYFLTFEKQKIKGTIATALEILKRGQRFYLPDAAYILKGNNLRTAPQESFNLPFQSLILLSELHMEDSVAADEKKQAGQFKMSLCVQSERQRQDSMFVIIPMAEPSINHPGRWCPIGPGGMVFHEDGEAKASLANNPENHHWLQHLTEEHIVHDLLDDVESVLNLTTIINLANTEVIEVGAPKKINSKRARNGKSLLRSYHVLKVGGEVWDTRVTSESGDGDGVRSHYRRGHIRRLHDGRCVWVRDTVVHGTRPGWVDKEYHANIR